VSCDEGFSDSVGEFFITIFVAELEKESGIDLVTGSE
jgi:hypothetical protein